MAVAVGDRSQLFLVRAELWSVSAGPKLGSPAVPTVVAELVRLAESLGRKPNTLFQILPQETYSCELMTCSEGDFNDFNNVFDVVML